MTPIDAVAFIVGYFGVAGLALVLMHRGHKKAMELLQAAHDEAHHDQERLIDSLQSQVAILEERHKV